MIIFAVIVFLIFLPIYFDFYFAFDSKSKKIYYLITYYKVFNLFKGYISKRKKGGFYIHHSNNKAKIVFIDFKSGKNFTLPSFLLVKIIYNVYFYSKQEKLPLSLFTLNAFSTISNVIGSVANLQKYRGNYYLKPSKNYKIIFDFNLGGYFNLFCIFQFLIANLIKKGVNYAKGKK